MHKKLTIFELELNDENLCNCRNDISTLFENFTFSNELNRNTFVYESYFTEQCIECQFSLVGGLWYAFRSSIEQTRYN